MDPILQVDRLSISFTQYGRGLRRRTLPVIRDLSLSLLPGQVTAVVGASGSGKSLLTHAILGLLPYNSRTEGTILMRKVAPIGSNELTVDWVRINTADGGTAWALCGM